MTQTEKWRWANQWKEDGPYTGGMGCLLDGDEEVLFFGMDGNIYCPVEASAHKIAAAPDMYEACKDAAINLEDWTSDEPEFEYDPEAAKSIARMLRAALAKADGKE